MNLTKTQKEELMNRYKDLRCADVRDGLDWLGYHHYGSMSGQMRPLWRTRAVGFAKTARYIPYDRPVPHLTGDAYSEWSGWYYGNVCVYPWLHELEAYDFPVLDMSGLRVGLMGSNNTLEGLLKGAVGYVADGGVRDTDEVILQKVPFWSTQIAQTMDQGRIQYESHNQKIHCAGVCVCPGDIVVADGDGVVAVPADIAADVALWAEKEHRSDKAGRRAWYEKLGMAPDESV